jgi:hypothetical protein
VIRISPKPKRPLAKAASLVLNKNVAFASWKRRSYRYHVETLDFRDRDGLLIADLYAALAAKAFFGVDCNGFTFLHFKHVYRTDLHAFLASFALVVIHCDFVRHLTFPPLILF